MLITSYTYYLAMVDTKIDSLRNNFSLFNRSINYLIELCYHLPSASEMNLKTIAGSYM